MGIWHRLTDLISMKKFVRLSLAALTLLISACRAEHSQADATPPVIEVPEGMETLVLGAGCFWCVEAFFEEQVGVHQAISGYSGGAEPNPNYAAVARGLTTHIETVHITYDPSIIGLRELIDLFWITHDPTRGDGVWPDFGPHYRSTLFYQNESEQAVIEASRRAYEIETNTQVATDIRPREIFYPAETYHQDYAVKNPNDRYVQRILKPKLEKLNPAIPLDDLQHD